MRISEICMTITDIEEIMGEVSKELNYYIKDCLKEAETLEEVKEAFSEDVDLTEAFFEHLSKKVVDMLSK